MALMVMMTTAPPWPTPPSADEMRTRRRIGVGVGVGVGDSPPDRAFITGGKSFDFLRNTIISIGKFKLRVKKYIIFEKIVSNEHISKIF